MIRGNNPVNARGKAPIHTTHMHGESAPNAMTYTGKMSQHKHTRVPNPSCYKGLAPTYVTTLMPND